MSNSDSHVVSSPLDSLKGHALKLADYILETETENLQDCVAEGWDGRMLHRHIVYEAIAMRWHLRQSPEHRHVNPSRAFEAYLQSVAPTSQASRLQSTPQHPEGPG